MSHISPLKPLAAAVLLSLPVLVQAQAQLEEVLVTAQKRSENLTDVPISIAAITAQSLEQTGVRSLGDVAEYIPNLEISGSNSYSTVITIRGVGSQSRNIGFDSRVGVYVDGVYTGQSPGSNQDILDLERIEVLRGPQGTLFGKNNVAGAINMITKKPAQEFGGEVRAEVGNMNSYRVTGIVDIPLGDNIFTKISINDQQRDGYVKSIYSGDEGGEQNSTSARFQLMANLSDSIEMNFAYDWTDTDRLTLQQRSIGTDAGLLDPKTKEFDALNNFSNTEEREIKAGALTFDWSLDSGYVVKSITSYRETSHHTLSDLDGGVDWAGANAFVFGITSETELDYAEEYDQTTQEFQLLSPTDQDLTWVAGLYYYYQDADSNRDAVMHNDPEHPFYAGGILPFPGDITYPLITYGNVETTSYAAYFNANYTINDAWSVGFGGRYTEEEKDADFTSDPSQSPSDVLGIGITLNAAFKFADERLNDDRTDSHFSPEANISYAINDEMNAYYRVATGFKSGGYNLDFITQAAYDANLEFDKEEVISHEIGIKGELYDRRLTFGAAVFYAAYDDYQVQQFLESTGDSPAGAAVIGNASEVETTGLEFEMKAVLMENLVLDAALGLLSAEYKDFPGGDTGADGSPVNLKGNRLPGSPEYSINLGIQYYLPLESLGAEGLFRLDYAYSGDYYGGSNNSEEEERILDDGTAIDYLYADDRTSVNARIGLSSMNDTWSVAVWGRNLTDENYGLIGEDIFGTYGTRDSLPRTYGVELGYRF